MKPEVAEKKYLKILRRMPGNRRVRIGAELYEMAHKIVESAIRSEFPKISEEDLKKKLRERLPK
ncbi:MAG: hypothetical protein HY929_06620 [Euryarchaeota archaeon]|nr:hypothetical protein [Euryarchaeota archaeon]